MTRRLLFVWQFDKHDDYSTSGQVMSWCRHGSLTRYTKLRFAHAPGMPGTISPPPTSKETASQRSRHAPRHVRDARAVMHFGIANPRWRGKHSRHSRRMRNSQFCVPGKRPIDRAHTQDGRWWIHSSQALIRWWVPAASETTLKNAGR